MKFGSVPVAEAAGGLLAHQVRAGAGVLRKGHRLTREDCAALADAGIARVTIARLEPGDLGEDEAAARLAEAAAGQGARAEAPFTGRANLFATHDGLFLPDRAAVDRLNALDPALTLATLPAFKRVEPGEMIGTVKIIPFAVPEATVAAGVAALDADAITVAPFAAKRVAMLSLRLPGLKETTIDKTVKITEKRLAALGSRLVFERRLDHAQGTLEAALAALDPVTFDLLLVFGAAAIADRGDIIPAAIAARGGRIVHFGMPVDPGNLLLLAEFMGKPVIGAPGCARSPRENGFDWILARLCANVAVTAGDIRSLGVGGLLMEIVSRPQPRVGKPELNEARAEAGSVAAIVLAAGRSTRFGGENKLLAPVGGRPMLAHVLDAARGAGLDPIIVVTGHESAAVRALSGAGIRVVDNPEFARGLSTSLNAGLAALPAEAGAALVMLGDMPGVSIETIRLLVAAAAGDAQAYVPVFAGRWGNPVLVKRALFASLMRLHGDQGARRLLEASREIVEEVPVTDAGVLTDIDTPDALEALQRSPAEKPGQ